jgi:hypothetical protein
MELKQLHVVMMMMMMMITIIIIIIIIGSSVGISTGYGLDGPGSNPGGGEIFRTCPDRPTQPPVQWVPGLSGG